MNNYEDIVAYAKSNKVAFAFLKIVLRKANWIAWYNGLPQKLLQAVTSDLLVAVERLLGIIQRPETINVQGEPLFTYVCAWNKLEMARLFVTKGHALDNMSPEQQHSLVIRCVSGGNIPMVMFLVRDCNISVRGPSLQPGSSALFAAVGYGFVQMAQMLLAYSPHIDSLYGGRTLLHICIAQRITTPTSGEMLDMLLRSGANPQVVDRSHESCLQFAVRFKSVEMVNRLLDGGADINQIDPVGNTALLVAVNHGFVAMSRLLQVRGADVNIVNQQGHTARSLAVKWGYVTMLEFL
jgi:ankyrin repeat protein